ncbi:MAG TPA: hypothetical protein VFI25_04055 [Planctomycetota bacterium]|jgi:hypothetical protein|nr:hypothetical protein [Planctomycetota bacterium]
MGDRAFTFRQGEQVAETFARHGVEYLFIGKAGAVFYGFPDTTQDVDIFPAKSRENGARIVAALRDLGFPVDARMEQDILAGKDFVQIRSGPFDIDLVFAPDGLESFAEAKRRMVRVQGKFPVASLEDIIRSKRAANRPRDRETLPRLEAFAQFLKGGGRPSL